MTWRRLFGTLVAVVLVTGAGPVVLRAEADVPPQVAPGAVVPDRSVLASKLGAVSKKSLTSTAGAVYTAAGDSVYVADKAMVPASTLKVLTAMAALDVLGPNKKFTTKVVSASKGRLILVAGGDPFLRSSPSKSVAAWKANLDDLVNQATSALRSQQVKKVKVSFNATLFSGPSYAPSWKKAWDWYTPRISSLTVNGGKSGSKAYTDPAVSTTKLFIKKLKAKGFTVSYAGSARKPAGARTVASVTSAPLSVSVGRMLRVSDNVAAETLARHVARVMHKPGSFTGASAALTSWLKSHKLWKSGMVMDGGSGLSSRTRLFPSVLARAVGLSLSDKTYSAVVSGLPVAGVSGTLEDRFDDSAEKAGRGVVHAKTGTLKKVAGLAGYVTTRDGTLLTFAFLSTHDGTHNKAAGNWLDRSATALATCGCQAAQPGTTGD